MSALRRLQEDFQNYVLVRDDRMQAHALSTAQVSAEERLAIYADGYRLRLLEALDTDYTGLHTLMGDDEFDAMGRTYIDAYPSAHFSLRWYGGHLSEFLRTVEPYSKYPVFAEMATFEWSKCTAFDAPDSTVSVPVALSVTPLAFPPTVAGCVRIALSSGRSL